MKEQSIAEHLRALEVQDAQHVLWHFGDTVLGLQPGAFTTRLLSALSVADAGNRARLAEAFPRLVAMFTKVQRTEAGLDELRDLVKAALA
jgi:hypothetical protein